MTYKQFNKVTIGDKLSMFDGGTLQAKYKMNVVVRLRETPENIKRNRRYAVVNLIEQNNTYYVSQHWYHVIYVMLNQQRSMIDI